MEKRIVECVPNFSEGRDKAVIRQITSAIESSGGVKLLDVDPGEATNRTVVTFVGSPEAVIEAAFAGVKRAAELIDMRRHKGAHPRMGATDVLPLIPICGITLAECAELARKLAERIAAELHVPTYCYEAAAFTPERRNLAVCRAGEYEALPEKLAHKEAAPDFGARPFDDGVARTGATTVGARDFLIAVNFNLNTTSTRRANAIAFDVREKGRPVREGNPITGKIVKDAEGNPIAEGDVIGIADGSIEAVDDSIDGAVLTLLGKMDAEDADTCTILAGEGYSDEDLEALVAKIEEAYDELEVDAQRGEQPLYPIVFSVE